MSAADPTDRSTQGVLVWDLPLRLCHWALVASLLVAFLSQWAGTRFFVWHRWAGYSALVLVLFRLCWGFAGTRYARFAEFLAHPRHLRAAFLALVPGRHVPRLGHSVTGGWMSVALLVFIGAQAALGLASNDEVMEVGPLAGYVSHATSNALSSLHRHLAYLLLALVVIHVLAVIYYRRVLGEDLVSAMVHGRKPATVPGAGISAERRWLALLLLLVVAGLVWALMATAPPEPELLF